MCVQSVSGSVSSKGIPLPNKQMNWKSVSNDVSVCVSPSLLISVSKFKLHYVLLVLVWLCVVYGDGVNSARTFSNNKQMT